MTEHTPIMKQYIDIKKKHRDKLLLFRMGDFYEFFYNDAKEASSILDIVLTSRGTSVGEKIPMAGFPIHSANNHISKLINSGKIVAICEQVSTEKGKNNLIDRRVVKVLTPGTIIDDNYLSMDNNNFICCVNCIDSVYALAILDVSSGYFCVSTLNDDASLLNEIERISPSEILISDKFSKFALFSDFNTLHRWNSRKFNYKYAFNVLSSNLNIKRLENIIYNKNFVIASGCLVDYVAYTQRCKLENIIDINILDLKSFLFIDSVTKTDLEIFKNLNGGFKNTLNSVIDNTLTPMGKRLLKLWLNSPLLSRKELNDRLASVSILKDKQGYLLFNSSLKKIGDLDRILTRVVFKKAKPIDLFKLSCALKEIPTLIDCFNVFKLNVYLKNILARFKSHDFLISLIDNSILVENDFDFSFIKSGYDSLLDKFRDDYNTVKNKIIEFEFLERKRVNIPTLKIKSNSAGYYFEISKNYLNRVPIDYKEVFRLKNCTRYINDQLYVFGSDIRNYEKSILDREKELYKIILNSIKEKIVSLYGFSGGVAILDVICSFSKKSHISNWVSPSLVDSDVIEIIDGRHPVVEESLSKHFVSNSLFLTPERKSLIITGVNMGGKSTYMRQCAQIIFLAHIGSHVPAFFAKIGFIDKILTRIGSSDDITNSNSTFMLEMREAANILDIATNKSFVLIDEIGRGTSVPCAIPLAWGIIYSLHMKSHSYTLFSTHFHELVKMSMKYNGIYNVCFPLIKIDNKLIFSHKLEEGYVTDSYGIEIARLAGIPENVINIALEKSLELEKENVNLYNLEGINELLNIIKNIVFDDTTPKEALKIIYELEKIYNEKIKNKI